MKKSLFIIAGMIMLAIAPAAKAQKIIEGDKKLSFLAGETSFKLQYVYDNMLVGKITEDEYRKKKVDEMNAKQKGKGDRWEKAWVDARANKYEPKFEELMGKFFGEKGASASKDANDAKYTIVVKTVMTEPGFNIGVMKQDPFVNYEISWLETATGKVMAKGILNRVAGQKMFDSGWDFDPTNSIEESYAKAGKVVAKTMLKAMKLK